MKAGSSVSFAVATAAFVFSSIGCGGSSGKSSGSVSALKVAQTNLVADTSGAAGITDPNLVNPWGISFSPTGAFWISDNTTGLSTLYGSDGSIVPLVVKIPAAGGGTGGPVTGQVYNATSSFAIPGSTAAEFIFDSEDGVITAWNSTSGSSATTVADRSATGAVYKGLAMGMNGGANFLYATNFNSGQVDVFDSNFALSKSFGDSSIPSGFAPFGITNINGLLYVTFAKQDSAKHDDVAGAGNGYVDVFNLDGTLKQRLISNGVLNSPWGVAVAPASFGSISGDLLVGNFGDGKVNVFNLSTGSLVGPLTNSSGTPIVIPGLWALTLGNGGQAGSTSNLYFTAGPGNESHGLFGFLAAAG